MINIIKNSKMRPRATKACPTTAAANGVRHVDQFGFFAVGFAVYFAAMALERIQRSMMNVTPVLFH
jgi:hypothetical protein